MIEKTAIISDIHGCIEEFREILYLLDCKSPYVRIICAGDFIDRGPDSVGCIRLARDLKLEATIANHEQNFLRWHHHHRLNKRAPRYPHYLQFNQEDIEYMDNMQSYINIPEHNAVVVHASLKAGVPLEKQSIDDLCYTRYMDKNKKSMSLRQIEKLGGIEAAGAHFWTEFYDGHYNVIYGHNVSSLDKPRIDHFSEQKTACYGIDTGCVFSGNLTSIALQKDKEPEIIQVKAKKTYYQAGFSVR